MRGTRAALHGRSMEAEIREILVEAVREPVRAELFSTLLDRMAEVGGVDLDVPVRSDPPRGADLSA